MTRRSVATAVAAVLGIAVSAALAWAASQLAGQRIGLSAEPLSVATGLAPHVISTPAPSTNRGDDRSSTAQGPPSGVSRSSTAQSPSPSNAPASAAATIPTGSATPSRSSTSAAATPPPSVTARDGHSSAGTARRPGRHGDGGDQHDD